MKKLIILLALLATMAACGGTAETPVKEPAENAPSPTAVTAVEEPMEEAAEDTKTAVEEKPETVAETSEEEVLPVAAKPKLVEFYADW